MVPKSAQNVHCGMWYCYPTTTSTEHYCPTTTSTSSRRSVTLVLPSVTDRASQGAAWFLPDRSHACGGLAKIAISSRVVLCVEQAESHWDDRRISSVTPLSPLRDHGSTVFQSRVRISITGHGLGSGGCCVASSFVACRLLATGSLQETMATSTEAVTVA
jgi:hypothetical protein